MTTVLCRDCTALEIFEAVPERCSACGSPRLVAHAELAELAIAHIDCDAFYATVEKRDRPELAVLPRAHLILEFLAAAVDLGGIPPVALGIDVGGRRSLLRRAGGFFRRGAAQESVRKARSQVDPNGEMAIRRSFTCLWQRGPAR